MSFSLREYGDRLSAWSDMQGHMEFLRETAAGYEDPVVIELGVRSGQSTSAFLAGIHGSGGHLWSADISDAQVPAHWRDLPNWHFLQADDRSPEALAWLPAQCDMLFIDTSHSYEHTLEELRAYGPRVRPGGTITMHDTQWIPGDTDTGTTAGCPVSLALDAWCAETGLEWVNRPGYYGLGVIRIPGP